MADSSREEPCPTCSKPLRRIYTTFHTIGTAVQNAEWNPGLGCVVKSKRDREEIARRKGLTEIGNDFGSGEKMQKFYDKKLEEKKEEIWKDPSSFEI